MCFFSSCKDTNHIAFEPALIQGTYLNLITSAKMLFQIKSHSQMPEASTYFDLEESGHRSNSTHNDIYLRNIANDNKKVRVIIILITCRLFSIYSYTYSFRNLVLMVKSIYSMQGNVCEKGREKLSYQKLSATVSQA